MDELRNLADHLAGLHPDGWVLAASVTVALATLGLMTWAARKLKAVRLATFLTAVSVLIVMAATTQGAWELAGHLERGPARIIPAVIFETIAVQFGRKARAYVHQHKHLGPWRSRLWTIGLIAGAIVASTGTTTGTCAYRFAIPVFGMWLVILELTPDETVDRPDRIRWLWTPRAALLWLRAIEPDDESETVGRREQQIRRMVRLRRKIAAGGKRVPRYRERLARLAETADPAALHEVRQRYSQSIRVEELTDPDKEPTWPLPANGHQPAATPSTSGHTAATAPTNGHDSGHRPPVAAMAGHERPTPATATTTAAATTGHAANPPASGGQPAATPTGHAANRPPVAEPSGHQDTGQRPPATAGPGHDTDTKSRVADYLAAHPGATGADVAAALGLTERTARRYVADARKHINGRRPELAAVGGEQR